MIDTGFGISEDVDIVRTDEASSVVSRHFHLQITEPEDIVEIKMPVVTYDAEATQVRYETLNDAVTTLGLDHRARVLLVSTEGATDPASYDRIVAPGE